MRVLLLFALSLLLGCGAQTPRPSGEPFRASDAAASQRAYQAYCNMCRNAETCCLQETDFAAERWSSTSGTYLRAMRDYYECQRSAVLLQARYEQPPMVPGDTFGALTEAGNTLSSCYPHACSEYAELMAAELDTALATKVPLPPRALVSCAQQSLP